MQTNLTDFIFIKCWTFWLDNSNGAVSFMIKQSNFKFSRNSKIFVLFVKHQYFQMAVFFEARWLVCYKKNHMFQLVSS